ncbi:MAG TPA: hypothetical protein PKL48_10720 [Thermodesulfobacteriota bacterium]|nr:hypothetical protein [Thermodesulfobacteriota bacterium]
MRKQQHERLADGVTIRTTARERLFLERLSAEQRLSMGESIRRMIDTEMKKREITA